MKLFKLMSSTLILFLVSMLSVYMTQAVLQASPSLSMSTSPGTSVSGTFYLNNTDPSNSINVSFSGLSFSNSGYQLNATQLPNITLGPNTTNYAVPVTVNVPSNQFAGQYTGTIAANGGVGGIQNIAVQLNVTAAKSLSLSNTSMTLIRGLQSSGSLMVAVTNTGNTNLALNYNYTNISMGTSVISAGFNGLSLTVPYLASGVMSIPVSISANQSLGTYTGNLVIYGDVSTSTQVSVLVRDPITSVSLPAVQISGDRNTNVSSTFTIKNTGDYTLNNIAVTTDADSKYNVQLTNVPGGLAPGQSQTVTVSLSIPNNEATTTHNIANIKLTSDRLNQTSALSLKINGQLKIDTITVKLDGNDNDVTSDGQTVDDDHALPGVGYDVTVKICNQFSDSDRKFKSVNLDAKWINVDNGDDIKGTIASFTLNGDDCIDKKITFDLSNIPYLVDEATYNMELDLEGTYNGTKQQDKWTIPVKVFRESDPTIVVTNSVVNPDGLDCNADSFSLDLKGVNTGDSNDESALEITSDALKISTIENFELGNNIDDDCDAIDNPTDGCIGFDHTFQYIIPTGLAPGTYPLTIKTFYDADTLSKTTTANVKINACGTGTVEQPVDQPGEAGGVVVVQNPPTSPTGAGTSGSAVVATIPGSLVSTSSFGVSNPTYLILIAVADLVLALILVSLIGLMFKK